MNLNALFGITGLCLLAFVAAFAFGRHTRPRPDTAAQRPATQLAASLPPPRTSTIRAYEEAEEETPSVPAPASRQAPAASAKVAAPAPTRAQPRPAASSQPDSAEIAAAQRAAEIQLAIAARRAHAAQLPEEFERYYAQELPADAISSEQDVKTTVAGKQAEVITLSSAAFNAINKDFVLEQVRSDLKELGFKRVYITNGRDFKTSFGL